jgi:ribosomal protein S18 acetylase RimI-like enzyme
LLDGQRTDEAEIDEILANSKARLVLSGSSEQLLGCVLVRNDAEGAYVGMLAVNPRVQAGGLGRGLLAEAERIARAEFQAKLARMTVIVQRQDLIGWYVRRGYVVTAHREPFPYGNPRFGLPRRPDLEFVVLEKVLAD